MNGDAEESSILVVVHLPGYVDEIGGEKISILKNTHPSIFLTNEQPPVRCIGDCGGGKT